jgi:CheY-like chemotaxis protein
MTPTPPPDFALTKRWWRLSVRDTGFGMDEETKRKIFEPFFTTKPVSMGTGLGLSVVYGIVKQHHGVVIVQSKPGEGTTFSILFPTTKETRAASTTPPPARPFLVGTETILMVEDDLLVRRVNRRVLTHLGYTVLEAKDGREGLELAEHHEGAIDILFTDIIMPHMNGFELAERVRSRRPGIKVLFTSGYSKHTEAPERFVDEGLELIAKPYAPEQLVERIQRLLRQEP